MGFAISASLGTAAVACPQVSEEKIETISSG